MKRMILVALIVALTIGCGEETKGEPKLKENTEEYFKAHGIVPGQPNELRIGGTLFRFPAGVGLNPHSATGIPVLMDGTPGGRPLAKEPLKIVRGQAERVTFYLNSARGYAPGADPFQSGDVRVTISKHGFYSWDGVNANLDELLKQIKGRKIIDHPDLGLREYVAPTQAHSEYFEPLKADIKSDLGHGQFFECHATPLGFTHPSGLCFRSYWNEKGNYQVEVVVDKPIFFEHWREIYPAATRFIDSVVVK